MRMRSLVLATRISPAPRPPTDSMSEGSPYCAAIERQVGCKEWPADDADSSADEIRIRHAFGFILFIRGFISRHLRAISSVSQKALEGQRSVAGREKARNCVKCGLRGAEI